MARRVESNNTFINENEIIISMTRFHVRINMICIEGNIYFELKLINSEIKETILDFKTLESAMTFAYEVIAKSVSIKEVLEQYKEFVKEERKTKKSTLCKRCPVKVLKELSRYEDDGK